VAGTSIRDPLADPATTVAPSAEPRQARSWHGPHVTSERLRGALVVGAPALLALALCLYELGTRSLWLDESATVAIASQHGGAFGAALARDGGNMLAYYALLHVLIGAFGDGAFVIRLPAALAAAATAAIVSWLAIRLFDRRVALAAGVLTAVSLPLVFWGQDARGYTAMIALLAGSFLALDMMLRGDGGWRAWIAYTALITAAVYMGLEAALVIPAQLLALIWYRGRARAVISSVVVAGILCIPLAVLAAGRGSSQLFWVPPPSSRIAGQVVQALTSSALQPSFRTSTSAVLLVLTLVVLGFAARRIWRSLRSSDRAVRQSGWAPVLIAAWLLVPAILALLESLVGQSIFQARYLLVSLPAVALLLGWALVAGGASAAQRPAARFLALATVLALVVLRALQVAPSYGVSFENWRSATSYVLVRTRPRDCAAFYPQDSRMPFKYYLRGRSSAPRSVLPQAPWSEVRSYVEDYSSLSRARVAGLPSSCSRVWLISSHEGKVGGPPASSADYKRYVLLQANLRMVYPRVNSRSFGYGGAVTIALYSR